jgi:hypothetical protein
MVCEGSLNFLPVGSSDSLIYAQRNIRMWDSMACHEGSRGGDRVGLEAANLVGVHPGLDCHTR